MNQLFRDGWRAGVGPLPSVVSATTRRTPEAVAVSSSGHELTYAQLDVRSNHVCHWLRMRGLGPENVVAVLMGRSIDLVVALLGVLKSGCAYVPLDVSHPPERVRFMIEDARADAVIADRDPPAGSCGTSNTRAVLRLDDVGELAPGLGPVEARLLPDNLAYITYTSGSTGRPKGVMVTHRGLSNYLIWAARTFPMAGRHGSLVHSSVAFDLTVTSLYVPLLSGYDVTLLPEGPEPVERLADALTGGFDYSIVRLTPSHLLALRNELTARRAEGRPADVSARALIVGGEALAPELVSDWRELAPNTLLYNHYGPSETVVGRVAGVVTGELTDARTVPIGLPVDNTSVHVVDSSLREVPVGVVGELLIGGIGLARGYLGRPGLTAERFVPDPVDGHGRRLYRTGDLVRRLPSGELEFVGRVDDQVKIRGHRVELGEVEAVLRNQSGVVAAAAATRDRGEGTELVGYVVWRDGTGDVARLRSDLLTRLPNHMVPTTIVALDQLPLSSSGKLDRRRLPEPPGRLDTAAFTGRNSAEVVVLEVWRRVLDVESIDEHDDFFALGGDSILAIRATAELRRAGYQATSGMFVEHPTLAAFAAVLRGTSPPRHRADQARRTGEVPLLPIQHWFFELGLRRQHHFNQAVLVEFADDLDPALLRRALSAVVDVHDALHMRYRREGDGWRQEYGESGGLLPVPRIERRPPDEFRAAATSLHSSLDLSSGPLVRAALVDGHALLLTAHHLVVDAVSWHVLLDDLAAVYARLREDAEIRLPHQTTSIGDWAARLARYATSDRLARQVPWWTAAAGRLPVPVDFSGGANLLSSERAVEVALSPAHTAVLTRVLPRLTGLQPHEIFVAAVGRAVGAWTGGDTVSLALEGHGRPDMWSDVDVSRTVGWFTALFPVRLRLPADGAGTAPWQDLAGQLRAVPDQGLGYGVLRYLARVDGLCGADTPDVLVNYVGRLDGRTAGQSRHIAGVRHFFGDPVQEIGTLRAEQGRRPHLISVLAGVRNRQLVTQWRFSREVHRESTIRGLAEWVVEDLAGLAAVTERHETRTGPQAADFPLARLDEQGMTNVLRALKG